MPQPFVYRFDRWEADLGRRELRADGMPVSLGSRAFDIFEVLVESVGRSVSKAELMDRVWPNTAVSENALYVHISAVRKALGRDKRFLKTASGRGYRLMGTWVSRVADREQVSGSTTMGSSRFAPSNVRSNGNELIGRTETVRQVEDYLSAFRAVTLTGPGGVGKTRLSKTVAGEVLPSFDGNGWLFDLAPLKDATLVASTVATTIGLELAHGEVTSNSIAAAIGEKKLLLVFDNCEHVIEAAARLVEAILLDCPRVSILSTSREALKVDGEYVFRVPGLVSPSEEDQTAASIIGHSAVKLFISRMGDVTSDPLLIDAELAAIGAICRHLDGMPLAIEFAAARAASLRPRNVLARLHDRFGLLAGGRRTALPRHQTLRATLDWSYDLLPRQEQRLLRTLSVFHGGFSLEAAIGTFDDNGVSQLGVDEMIANLVEKSLIDVDDSGAGTRWRLLETTRAYALEKLVADGRHHETARRHAEYYRSHFRSPGIANSRREADGLQSLIRDLGNVRAALDWAFSLGGDRTIGIDLTATYVPVWLNLSLIEECRERVERAVAALQEATSLDERTRMLLLASLGAATMQVMAVATTAEEMLEEALSIADDLNDVDTQLQALWGLWGCDYYRGEYKAAKSYLNRLSDITRSHGDLADVLVAERCIAINLHFEGDQEGARSRLERVLNLYEPPPDQRHARWFHHDQKAVARAFLARVQWLQGDIDLAIANADLALEEVQAAGNDLSTRYILGWVVCPLAILTGRLEVAGTSLKTYTNLVGGHHPPYWKAVGSSLTGMLAAKSMSAPDNGESSRALFDYRERRGSLARSAHYLATLAEGMMGRNRISDAVSTIEEAFERSEKTGEKWALPELHRIKGELLLRQPSAAAFGQAEECFVTAGQVSRDQGALSWELKAATSLAGLRLAQRRNEDAFQVLAPVFDRFHGGFGTADLIAAKTLLDLAASS